MPAAFWVSRMCEEFGCLPSQIEAEVARQPVGWLDEVLEARAYARTKQAYDRDPKSVERSGMGALVVEIDFTLAQEAMQNAAHG